MRRNLAAALAEVSNDQAEVYPLWPAPDMSIVDGGRRSPPTLPDAMFGTVWPECVKLAQDKGAPADYVALAYLSVAASIIGGKRKVRPYAEGTWEEPSIIWLGLVGDPSSNKSPALDPMLKVLRRMEAEGADHHKDRLAVWQADTERAKIERTAWQAKVKEAAAEGVLTPALPAEAMDPDAPRRRRLLVQDATPESMGEVLAGNPQGTLLMRDELDGWLSSFDRYNPGGKSYWLEAYRGQTYTIDRKSNPNPLTVGFNGVSIIGGIQPQKLAESLLGKIDDGLPARFLWCWPDRAPFARPTATADLDAIESALRRLEGLQWGYDGEGKPVGITLPLDPPAADVFACLQQAHRSLGDEASGLLKSFIGKLDGIALRLALVSEYARWAYEGGDEPRSVGKCAVEAVADFLETYAIPMAARVYGDAALPPVERHAATLARHIQRHKLRTFNGRLLRRKARLPGMADHASFNEAVEALVEAEWLRADFKRDGPTQGRQREDYSVNPLITGAANG